MADVGWWFLVYILLCNALRISQTNEERVLTRGTSIEDMWMMIAIFEDLFSQKRILNISDQKFKVIQLNVKSELNVYNYM